LFRFGANEWRFGGDAVWKQQQANNKTEGVSRKNKIKKWGGTNVEKEGFGTNEQPLLPHGGWS
jgi:hypothetical protein